MNRTAWIKPRWSPLNIALMVFGFIIFWPLGLLMVFYMSFGKRWASGKQRRSKAPRSEKHRDYHFGRAASEDFGERRKHELDQIERERRTLEEMKAKNAKASAEPQDTKDREEFASFVKKRRQNRGNQGPQKA
ncbi:DUF2852 domain-containing protein [Rhizobium sp. L1K21]|uniref:DUF2852 domain-containing protein n=1 Tax=Rhizobium sp. L1K21 TaxID=2954933 RepID=UPI0020920F77|nr:DUF2852 domain-containing protein [Rhizobium sp. L1K21]MCO6187992.1 DUF2852 domain-containing protein [Rhizobium sp. L1K21]